MPVSGHSHGSYEGDSATSAGVPLIGKDRRVKEENSKQENEDRLFMDAMASVVCPCLSHYLLSLQTKPCPWLCPD